MPLLELERKPRRSAGDVARLTLTIAGIPYAARILPVDPSSGAQGLTRLRSPDGSVYHLVRLADRVECDCGDYVFRHDGQGTSCKHVRAAVAVGLI